METVIHIEVFGNFWKFGNFTETDINCTLTVL